MGSRVTLWSYSPDQNINGFGAGVTQVSAPEGPAYTVTVVGIVREAITVNAPTPSIVADAAFEGSEAMILTPAFLARFASDQGALGLDVVVGNPHTPDAYAGDPDADPLHSQMVGLLGANGYVSAFSGFALTDEITVDARAVDIAGIETDKGSVVSLMVEGRAPVAADEIAMGRDTLRQLHRHVGQTVTVGARGQSIPMRTVGVSLQATAGDLSTRLARGGAVTSAGLRRLVPDAPALQFAVRYRPGVD